MRKKILIVDDEYSVRTSIEDTLREILEEKLKIYTASNGREALNILEKEKFNFIVSDIDMPVMNGFQLLKELEKINNDSKIIMMSGINRLSEFSKFKNVIGFLKKPLRLADLFELADLIT